MKRFGTNSDRGPSPVSSENGGLENTPIPKSQILFLRDLSTPSLLIEQGLRRAGHEVTSHQHSDAMIADCGTGHFDLALLDYGLPIQERLSTVRSIRAANPNMPVVMVFNTNAEREVAVAMSENVSECVIRDKDGAYLFKISDVVERILESDDSHSARHNTTPSISPEDITQTVDLSSIAKEVKGVIVDSKKAAFVVLAGPDLGKVVQLDGPLMLIGRDASCQLALKDDSVSRFHASVKQHSSGVVTIRDLGSTNGTFIDGRRVQIEELKEGSKILLGKNTVIRYQTQDSIDKSYYDDLYFSSTRDELTGVYNRRFCMEKIGDDLSFARRHGLPVSLIMFDIDYFKQVNDTYGHLTGDAVLAAVARVTAATLRQEDVLGRYGGEEFVVFALDTDLKGASALAERIRKRVEREEVVSQDGSSRTVKVTVSLGIASGSPGACKNVKALVSAADEKLYEAKASGRNCARGVSV